MDRLVILQLIGSYAIPLANYYAIPLASNPHQYRV